MTENETGLEKTDATVEPVSVVDKLEALLFVANAPATLADLANAVGAPEGAIEQALELLERRMESSGAIQLVRLAGGYQLSTKSEFSEVIAAFLKPQNKRLSRSAMEVLAIVAYKQPMTIADVEEIRGVQSDYGVRVLLERNLIQEVGRKPTPGRPVLYGTTQEFLHRFNLNDLKELPPLEVDALLAKKNSDTPPALESSADSNES